MSSTDPEAPSNQIESTSSVSESTKQNETARRDFLIAGVVALAASIPVTLLFDMFTTEKEPAQSEIQVLVDVDEDFLKERGVRQWDVWESSSVPSKKFDYTYDKTESVYIIDGEAVVTPKDGRKAVVLKPKVFASFPKGLNCVWDVKSPVRKYYKEYNAILGFE